MGCWVVKRIPLMNAYALAKLPVNDKWVKMARTMEVVKFVALVRGIHG